MNLWHVLGAGTLAWLSLLAAGCGPSQRAPGADGASGPLRVLFIGNSYTYSHDMPRMVQQLAAAAGERRPLQFEMETPGGESLEGHWKKGAALQKIRRGGWDLVVLQEQSLRPIEGPDLMHEYARLFDAEIRKAGARTVFYLTWARKHMPDRQGDYNAAYLAIGRELAALVAPAGMAWARAAAENPACLLYEDDKSHPRPVGAYLTACVFYATFYGRSPAGLPVTIKPDQVAAAGLKEADLARLQAVAWETVRAVPKMADRR